MRASGEAATVREQWQERIAGPGDSYSNGARSIATAPFDRTWSRPRRVRRIAGVARMQGVLVRAQRSEPRPLAWVTRLRDATEPSEAAVGAGKRDG